MLERFCDALVIGTEISGLITAAFLARRGLTVHVLDPDPYFDNKKEPDPFCVAHLQSKLLRSILGRLNVPENDIQFLAENHSPLQIIFPNKRIDVSANPLTFYEELEREFPLHHEKLKLFYENLVTIKHRVDTQEFYSLMLPHGFSERRQFKKFIKANDLESRLKDLDLPIKEEKTLKNFLMSQIKLLTYAHNETPFSFQVADLLNPSEGEVLSIRGGHHYLKKLFLSRIEHHEGAYRPEAKIEKLLYRNGIFEGANLSGIEGNILARYVIWNTHLKRLGDYLPQLFRFRKLRKAILRLEPSANWFTAHFEMPRAFIPTPMHDNLIIINNPNGDLKEGNYLYVQKRDEGADATRLSVSYLLPTDDLEKPDSEFTNLHEDILQTLKNFIPFCADKIKLVFPLTIPESDEGTLFPLKENDFEIFRQTAREHPIYELQTKEFADLFPISYKTPAPNFFLTAPEILASMGYEGKYMLGLKVTDIIWKDVEKEKKHAMKTEKRIA